MLARTTLFLFNRSQAVRLPFAIAFKGGVREVVVTHDGPRRIIAPADAAWDDFFDEPGIDFGARHQLISEDRGEFLRCDVCSTRIFASVSCASAPPDWARGSMCLPEQPRGSSGRPTRAVEG